MNNFDIDIEIDKLVDKLCEQFKSRLKKLVVRSEKKVLRDYIASQKSSTKQTRTRKTSKALDSDREHLEEDISLKDRDTRNAKGAKGKARSYMKETSRQYRDETSSSSGDSSSSDEE
jgi:hypothetical protein